MFYSYYIYFRADILMMKINYFVAKILVKAITYTVILILFIVGTRETKSFQKKN